MAQSHELTHPKYRPDIDGLRAISVLSVIGFHAFPGWLRDGFVGVDIFFVISGFLISTIIFENLERGSFSFREFYRRRIKRIFPALAVVLATCLIFGWFELLADEYEALGRHVAAGVGFVSNYLLWSENGYFDAAAETKPLLHLWSLGIEEQFYIVWPFLLWLAWRQKISLVVVIGAIAALSFGLNVWRVHGDTAASFYSPQTRFWELLVGAALAYLAVFKADTLRTFVSPRNSQFLSLGGVALLAICFVLVSSDREFPGWWALLPTMSAALLLAAGMQGWVNRRILSNPVLVWFGLISFPLYLWHWPLLSFLRIVVNKPDPAQRLAAIAISIILAWLTYRAVERPIRFGAHKFEPAYALAGALLLIGSAGYTSVLQNGFPGYGVRTTEIAEFAQYFENSLPGWHYYEITGMNDKYREDCDFYDISRFRIGRATTVPIGAIDRSCYQRTPHGQKTLFIWGDSHAKQLYYGLNNNLPNSWDVLIVASAGCKPSLSAKEDSATDYCQRSNWFALKSIRETHPDVEERTGWCARLRRM